MSSKSLKKLLKNKNIWEEVSEYFENRYEIDNSISDDEELTNKLTKPEKPSNKLDLISLINETNEKSNSEYISEEKTEESDKLTIEDMEKIKKLLEKYKRRFIKYILEHKHEKTIFMNDLKSSILKKSIDVYEIIPTIVMIWEDYLPFRFIWNN